MLLGLILIIFACKPEELNFNDNNWIIITGDDTQEIIEKTTDYAVVGMGLEHNTSSKGINMEELNSFVGDKVVAAAISDYITIIENHLSDHFFWGDIIFDTYDDDIDGDGISNKDDDDMDGDGTNNDDDTDDDGDGINDSEDPEPYTINDTDTDDDGTPNIIDEDIDGDGILNTDEEGLYDDMDGDGIENCDDIDYDGDGQLDFNEIDTDNDGIPNNYDDDIDGDGINNDDDDDIDGDGINNVDSDGKKLDWDTDGDMLPDDWEGVDENNNDIPDFFEDLEEDDSENNNDNWVNDDPEDGWGPEQGIHIKINEDIYIYFNLADQRTLIIGNKTRDYEMKYEIEEKLMKVREIN